MYNHISPSLETVRELFSQGDLVPVYRFLPADLETPVSIFLKLFDENEAAFLLESVEGGEQVSRYSFIGVQPRQIIKPYNSHDVLETIKQDIARYKPVALPGLPRFVGGAVGYISYDYIRKIESRVPDNSLDDVPVPEAMFMLYEDLIIFDHVKAHIIVLANAHNQGDPDAACQEAIKRIEKLVERIKKPLPELPLAAGRLNQELESTFTQAEFESAVEAAKEYIRAGDAFQIVLSQRLSRKTSATPVNIYRALRMLNPSPYMFFLHYPADNAHQALTIVGASPEMLVRLEDGIATVRPIAGTRPRGKTYQEDVCLAEELLQDPKECAEHIMLVDLGRNDLGRVCEYGSVKVPDLMVIERYSHVMHIVSSVEGRIRPEYDAFDLLRATFPAGTVSGAPKIRAMEIIDELEKTRRNIYAGGVGYFSFDGSMDTCISIRTLVMVGDKVYVQAGAGIVADSDPTGEYQECYNKARALAEAIKLAEEGF
ncbi:MAG: anthranilate synthase component I [Anaerolineae bacterium]|nr:MAG: anthranilate synthase component I [Anaerolineae bacterium]